MKRFRVPEIVIGLLLGIVLSLFAAGVGSYQTSQCEQAKYHNTKAPTLEQPSPATQQSNYGQHQVSEEPKHSPYFGCGAVGLAPSIVGFMDAHEGFFVGGFTLALFLATILLWLAGERQMELIAENSAKQSRDMQASIDVADRSAVAAQKSAEIAERALNSTERAFVFMKNIYASPVYDPTESIVGWDFHVVWENSGATPTQFMVSRKQWMIWPEGNIPDDFNFPDIGSPFQSKSYIGPKAVIDAGALQVSNEMLATVADSPARMLIWGWAEYNDIFSPTVRHRSEFCAEVAVDGSLEIEPNDRIKPPFVFLVYKQHNGTGDECYRKPTTKGFG